MSRLLPILFVLLAFFGSQTVALGQIDAYPVAANNTVGQYDGVRALSQTLRDAGVPRADRLDVINSFREGSITLRQATGNENVLRFFGGEANQLGRYVTPNFPQGSARSLLALPPNNSANGLIQFNLRPGATFFEGTVAPNFGKPGGGALARTGRGAFAALSQIGSKLHNASTRAAVWFEYASFIGTTPRAAGSYAFLGATAYQGFIDGMNQEPIDPASHGLLSGVGEAMGYSSYYLEYPSYLMGAYTNALLNDPGPTADTTIEMMNPTGSAFPNY